MIECMRAFRNFTKICATYNINGVKLAILLEREIIDCIACARHFVQDPRDPVSSRLWCFTHEKYFFSRNAAVEGVCALGLIFFRCMFLRNPKIFFCFAPLFQQNTSIFQQRSIFFWVSTCFSILVYVETNRTHQSSL